MGPLIRSPPKLFFFFKKTLLQNVLHNLLFTLESQTENKRWFESLGEAVRSGGHNASQSCWIVADSPESKTEKRRQFEGKKDFPHN